ncbi:hypothetical protein ABTK17_19895, partial [Acinetobacter baumannii]
RAEISQRDPHDLNYWRQDERTGKWKPDSRNTFDAVSTNGWPDYLVRMLFDFVNHHYLDPDVRIAEVNDRNVPGMDRPPKGYLLSE